jgi:hypothetical protein
MSKDVPLLVITNNAQEITDTNYWDSPQALRGWLFLSWNAGAARLLVPSASAAMLEEMRDAESVVVSRGAWEEAGEKDALEVLFEDYSDAPFRVLMLPYQCDRLLPPSDEGKPMVVSVWTRLGKQFEWPGLYQRVAALPT